MRCQRIGRYPTGTIGFGIDSEYSRSLIPRPPQKITTFMPSPSLRANRGQRPTGLSRRHGRWDGRSGQEVLEPALAAEALVLLRAQSVREPTRGQLDIVVREHLVFRDRPPEPAALDQALG